MANSKSSSWHLLRNIAIAGGCIYLFFGYALPLVADMQNTQPTSTDQSSLTDEYDYEPTSAQDPIYQETGGCGQQGCSPQEFEQRGCNKKKGKRRGKRKRGHRGGQHRQGRPPMNMSPIRGGGGS